MSKLLISVMLGVVITALSYMVVSNVVPPNVATQPQICMGVSETSKHGWPFSFVDITATNPDFATVSSVHCTPASTGKVIKPTAAIADLIIFIFCSLLVVLGIANARTVRKWGTG